jgi:hypothetical protein
MKVYGMSITISGAEAIIDGRSAPDWYGPSILSLNFYALDDVGCNGSESNLLDCLPDHNCGRNRGTGAENAGVQCLRKGTEGIKIIMLCFHRPTL